MSGAFILLTLRSVPESGLDVEGVSPDRLTALGEHGIASLPVWAGSRAARLGDFFDVRGERSDRVRIDGDLSRLAGVGAGMAGGEIVVSGSAGHRAGAGMSGGRLEIVGNVGDDAGRAMAGGLLLVRGSAGHRVGAATPGAAKGMTGGEIVVEGSVGSEAGARARRGLIVVGGDCGDEAGRSMIAGSLVVLGRTGANPGRGNKRGSIAAAGAVAIPSTYRYACTYKPPHLRMTLNYLRRRYGLSIDERLLDGTWRRYCGDAGEPGKGEILELVR